MFYKWVSNTFEKLKNKEIFLSPVLSGKCCENVVIYLKPFLNPTMT
jgi:hypothetical protein